MTNLDKWIQIPCLKATQPLGTFYVGIADSKDMVRITWTDIRRIASERREVETYLGIERPLSSERVIELKEYVYSQDATFPSTIIVAVASQNTQYDENTATLSLRDGPDVAQVLDGQHRLAGVDQFDGHFDLLVTVFVDIDIENQALLFATINLEQTKVNRSLAYDLYDYATTRSPFKTAHDIVRLLNDLAESPFKDKIKVLGVAGDPDETISQAMFVNALMPMIARDPKRDRNILKRGGKLDPPNPADDQRFIFRRMFIDEDDDEIADVIWNYFDAVAGRWKTYWTQSRPGFVLNRSTGFNALMQFLPFAYRNKMTTARVPSKGDFAEIFARVKIEGQEITPQKFRPGSGGQRDLRELLKKETGLM